ncbi:MAG: 1-deoxy-D-xylulose-5-phosphate reductoisomerase [Actinomycetota bacterium]|nr:1-deoxy-D-xylulose-5-phosphate reductoisomerase [Actinomycetota bacterium]
MKSVSLVGSTGSIGRQTLEVVRAEPDRYRIVALGASTSVDALVAQAVEFRPERVAIADASLAAEVRARVPSGTAVEAGPDALADLAREADVVVNGVVGFAGLLVTLAALESGRRLALANKESLIAAGPVVQRARATPGAEIVPVDSEHCAVHQCLRGRPEGGEDRLARIVLTASGGPFRGRSASDLAEVSVDDALAHPTWSMGPKITVDSSTLMNKGLEVIEAHELFGVDYDRIQVVVHPQSVVHSMVEFSDGAVIAQLSMPDMRLPIGYALAYPDRSGVAFGALDWSKAARLDFEPPDLAAFPCLGLAYAAGRVGGTAPAWLNAANEVAVDAFLKGLMPWAAIADVIQETLDGHDGTDPDSADVVIEADRKARELARRALERRTAAA